ncbi:MAG: hypothetical protein GX297_07135 [Treponema sp.]|nr:hypothetical protein [Treponema sp.]
MVYFFLPDFKEILFPIVEYKILAGYIALYFFPVLLFWIFYFWYYIYYKAKFEFVYIYLRYFIILLFSIIAIIFFVQALKEPDTIIVVMGSISIILGSIAFGLNLSNTDSKTPERTKEL